MDHRSGIHPCCFRHHRVYTGPASGMVLGPPAYPGGKLIFYPRVHRWKHDPYHSWKAPCSFRVATKYIREFCTRRMPVLIRGSRWLHGRNTVPSRSGKDYFSSVYSGTENYAGLIFFYPRYAGPPKDHAGCLPGVYTDDGGDNTDDPGAMTRDGPCCDPWMSEKPL